MDSSTAVVESGAVGSALIASGLGLLLLLTVVLENFCTLLQVLLFGGRACLTERKETLY